MIPPKVAIIRGSLRCRLWAIFSLIPILGLPCTILAFRQYNRCQRIPLDWNPAHRQLRLGLILARLGLILSLITLGLLVLPLFIP